MFRLLDRYRYLRSTYIHAFVGGASETRFKERLGDLFHEGYLDRPSQQWMFANAHCVPVVHELGARARGLLAEEGNDPEPRTYLSTGAHRQFQHAVLICECLAAIELATIGNDALRFIPWSGILARAPETTRNRPMPFKIVCPPHCDVVPDGLFGLEYLTDGKRSYRFFALEIDRETMPVARTSPGRTSYLGKLDAYRRVMEEGLHKTQLGIPNLMVLTVATGKRHLNEIVRKTSEAGLDGRGLLFGHWSYRPGDRPPLDLLSKAWERPGEAPLFIDRT
jgi:hypothetical protein